MADGVTYYGQAGLISSAVLIGIAIIVALHASMAIRAKGKDR